MTASQPLADDIRRFVLTSVPSVPYLEAMLLFHRSPGVEHGAAQVARALYLNERAAAGLLVALCEAGVLEPAVREPAPTYRLAPREPALAAMIDRLAQAYAADLIGITALIHDSTQHNAQRFADAFKLRKDR